MRRHLPGARRISVLDHVDPLPPAQLHVPVPDRDRTLTGIIAALMWAGVSRGPQGCAGDGQLTAPRPGARNGTNQPGDPPVTTSGSAFSWISRLAELGAMKRHPHDASGLARPTPRLRSQQRSHGRADGSGGPHLRPARLCGIRQLEMAFSPAFGATLTRSATATARGLGRPRRSAPFPHRGSGGSDGHDRCRKKFDFAPRRPQLPPRGVVGPCKGQDFGTMPVVAGRRQR